MYRTWITEHNYNNHSDEINFFSSKLYVCFKTLRSVNNHTKFHWIPSNTWNLFIEAKANASLNEKENWFILKVFRLTIFPFRNAMVYHRHVSLKQTELTIKTFNELAKATEKNCSLFLPCALVCIQIRLITLLICFYCTFLILSNWLQRMSERERSSSSEQWVVLLSSNIMFNFLQQKFNRETTQNNNNRRKPNVEMLFMLLNALHILAHVHTHTLTKIHWNTENQLFLCFVCYLLSLLLLLIFKTKSWQCVNLAYLLQWHSIIPQSPLLSHMKHLYNSMWFLCCCHVAFSIT